MTTLAFLLATVVPGQSPNDFLAKMLQTQRAMAASPAKSFSVSASVTGMARNRFFVRSSGDLLTIDHTSGATAVIGQSDRKYSVSKGTFTGTDQNAGEWLQRAVPEKGNLLQRFEVAFGRLDDAVRVALSPAAASEILGPLAATGGWQAKKTASETILSRGPISGVTTLVRLDSSSRLKQLKINSQGSVLNWEYKWDTTPQAPVALAIPRGASKVTSFTALPPPPNYKNAQAAKVGQAFLRANSRLRRSTIVVNEVGAPTRTLFFGQNQFGERTNSVGFGFDGKLLSVRTKAGLFVGPVKSGQIIDRLANNGFTIDPIMREVLARNVPFQGILRPGTKVDLAGVVGVDGVNCDILRCQSPQFRVSFFVRQSDGLAQSLTSETLDSRGRVRSTTTLAFKYIGVGTAPSLKSFQMPAKAGERAQKLKR